MKIKILSFLLLVIVSTSTYARCETVSCSGIGADVITSVYLPNNGNIYLGAPVDRGNLNCTLVDRNYIVLQSDHLLFKETFSTILTALSAQKELIVRIDGNSPSCKVSYVQMMM